MTGYPAAAAVGRNARFLHGPGTDPADLPDDGAASAAHVVADLGRALAEPFRVDRAEHRARVSIGSALFPRDALSVRDLVARADAGMYRHKRPRTGPAAAERR